MKTKTKTKIIRDINGHRLQLTQTRLVEIEHDSLAPWYTTKEDIRRTVREGRTGIAIHQVGGPQTLGVSFVSPGEFPFTYGRIGCRKFDVATFQLILRWFGARKTRARAAKAGL